MRKFLASLVAVALLSGLPGFVAAQAAIADCEAVAAPSQDDGCCGVTDMASCSFACSGAAAAAGEVNAAAVRLHAGSPFDRSGARTRSVSRPPDTAPPKSLPA